MVEIVRMNRIVKKQRSEQEGCQQIIQPMGGNPLTGMSGHEEPVALAGWL